MIYLMNLMNVFVPDMVETSACFLSMLFGYVWIRFDGSFMCGQYSVCLLHRNMSPEVF